MRRSADKILRKSMRYRRFMLIVVVAAEAVALILLGRTLIAKINIREAASVFRIRLDDVIFTPSDTLKNFYEPAPNTLIEDASVENWISDLSRYRINSDSLNERFEYPIPKPEGVFRIIALGDSHTFGATVDTAKNYPETLEDMLNERVPCGGISRFEVINLGGLGYDLGFSVERYLRRGAKYEPDLVVWLVLNNDFVTIADFLRPRAFSYATAMREANQFSDMPNPYEARWTEAWRLAREDLRKEFGAERIEDYQMKALEGFVRFYSGPLVVLNYAGDLNGRLRSRLREILNRRKGGGYFFGGVTNISAEPSLHQPDMHPNAAGYAAIARDVFDFLAERRLIPCISSPP